MTTYPAPSPRLLAPVLALALALVPLAGAAQGTAMAEARARLVCGSGTVVSANYIPGGLLQATCRDNAPRANEASNSSTTNTPTTPTTGNVLGTGGLGSTTLTVAVVVTGVALGVVSTGDDTTATTQTEPVAE